MNEKLNNRYSTPVIIIVSILIPLVVAVLLFIPYKLSFASDWVYFLPHFNGALNTSTTFTLVAGFIFIKRKNVNLHNKMMVTSFILGSIFLISYVIYHASAESTIFGDINRNGILEPVELEEIGSLRSFYLVLLVAHIVLAVFVVPFVLFAFYFALTDRIAKHKKVVRFTLPIWLFVSVSGVLVYLMIRNYY